MFVRIDDEACECDAVERIAHLEHAGTFAYDEKGAGSIRKELEKNKKKGRDGETNGNKDRN